MAYIGSAWWEVALGSREAAEWFMTRWHRDEAESRKQVATPLRGGRQEGRKGKRGGECGRTDAAVDECRNQVFVIRVTKVPVRVKVTEC